MIPMPEKMFDQINFLIFILDYLIFQKFPKDFLLSIHTCYLLAEN